MIVIVISDTNKDRMFGGCVNAVLVWGIVLLDHGEQSPFYNRSSRLDGYRGCMSHKHVDTIRGVGCISTAITRAAT